MRRIIAQTRWEAAKKRLEAYIAQFGGKATESDMYRWTVNTPLGELRLSMHDDDLSIFARWEDLDKAKAYFGATRGRLNPFSGKWNFHGPQLGSDPFEAFKDELDAVMASAPAAAAA